MNKVYITSKGWDAFKNPSDAFTIEELDASRIMFTRAGGYQRVVACVRLSIPAHEEYFLDGWQPKSKWVAVHAVDGACWDGDIAYQQESTHSVWLVWNGRKGSGYIGKLRRAARAAQEFYEESKR